MSDKSEEAKPKPAVIALVRHALTDWVRDRRLAGRTPEVHLNAQGKDQAQRVAERLATWPLVAVYTSPLARAQQTAAVIAAARELPLQTSAPMAEVDYGDWTGQNLDTLGETPLWRQVQTRPSAVRFPGGESLRSMQQRAVDELERLSARHPSGVTVVVSHADVIKAVLAHYLGMHLDMFQRLVIRPASISLLAFTAGSVAVTLMNDTAHLPQEPVYD